MARSDSRECKRRLTVDNYADDSGHRWQRLYFDDVLVDVRCADCTARPLDLIATNNGDLRPCNGMVESMMRGMGLA